MRISDWSSDVCSSDLDGSRMCTDRRGRAGSNAESGGRWLGIAGLDAADTRYSGLATFLASRRADAATGIFGTDDWSVEHGCRAHRSDYRRGRGLWSVVDRKSTRLNFSHSWAARLTS